MPSPSPEHDYTLTDEDTGGPERQRIAEALHRHTCSDPDGGEPCSWLNEHVDATSGQTCTLRGAWFLTGLEDAVLGIVAAALKERGLDPAPATVGVPYRHAKEPICGRVCYRLADGSGWWPMRWETGGINPSGASFCLAFHPSAPDPGGG